MMVKIAAYGIIALGVVAFGVGLSAASGWVLEQLWNFVVPTLFNGPSIDFLHAWALSVILGFIGGAVSR